MATWFSAAINDQHSTLFCDIMEQLPQYLSEGLHTAATMSALLNTLAVRMPALDVCLAFEVEDARTLKLDALAESAAT
ncbi:hypothetical protein GGE67_004460 [Rhizobium leucaenae]|uniref:Uncharacterized protein n=1 Tax=Rhizobium leucaenae TaxID=29450 RepID=A0A7W6ZYX5_9HYPH|nr:hypothetical protein [Rhizobium leucaenae]MBB6303819.1 hypothetical protein [Rhizobium leucaenae]